MRRTQLLGLSLNGSLDLGGSLLRCGSLDLLGLLAGALLRLLAAVLNGAASTSASAAAFLFALPPQLTIATDASTTTKDKIFFIVLSLK